ncbi:MAG: hypothetical protein V4563_01110 [Pseudomonadota bacterium]
MRRAPPSLPKHQRGALLILLVIALGILAATVFVSMLSSSQIQIDRDKKTAAALAEAKASVLGYAITNQRTPGGLPFPDRNGDGNYDGNGDCYNRVVSPSLLLGELPYLNEVGCYPVVSAFNTLPLDAGGERLWVAISSNLLRSNNGNYPVINTSTLMANAGWFTVSDGTGLILSNHVAFVLLAPGGVLTGQSRSGNAPNPQNFLDDFTVGASIYQNWNMLNPLGFITTNPVNNAANHFNDSLLYVTRDELISRLVDRIAGEIRLGLNIYYQTNHTYPATLTSIATSLPSWFNTNSWTTDTVYTLMTPNQATIGFQGCTGSTFTITWNSTTQQSDMLRNGPC